MDLIQLKNDGEILKTEERKRLNIEGEETKTYDVYAIPLDLLYYNNQNGRINTTYKKYISEREAVKPAVGNSGYNKIFENFIYQSDTSSLKKTLESVKSKGQQEPGVVLIDGRVIDGNRRFTVLRMIEREKNIPEYFKAVILPIEKDTQINEKRIKMLELDLQLGREERVNYNPIDSIFDVYNTIKIEKIMNKQEYRDASGAGNTIGINRDIRLAELIIKFIEIVSPGGNPIDKFYLARDLKLDGPMQEIESTINKLKTQNKESITDATLTYLVASKAGLVNDSPNIAMRNLKNNVLTNPDLLGYFLDAVDDRVDDVFDLYEDKPIQTAPDLRKNLEDDIEIYEETEKLVRSTNRLINRGEKDASRKKALIELEDIIDKLGRIDTASFEDLTPDEFLDAKQAITDINEIIFKLRKEI